jgi:hypothetical protein
MKLTKILETVLTTEIGDTSNVETYKYSTDSETYIGHDEELYQIGFTTESDTKYKVEIQIVDRNEDNNWRMDIEFGVEEYSYPLGVSYDFKSVVNKGELYKVMATVVQITKDLLEKFSKEGKTIKKIEIEPSKNFENDTRRANLYLAYIKKNMPQGSRVEVSPNFKKIDILLP